MNTNQKAGNAFPQGLSKDLENLIKKGPEHQVQEKDFDELAFRLFSYQYDNNIPYRKFCQKKGVAPTDVTSWKNIPAVPTDAFKELPLCTFPHEEAVRTLSSSGTTQQTKRSVVYFDEVGMKFLDLSAGLSSKPFIFPEGKKLHTLMFIPSPKLVPPTSTVAYGCIKIVEGNHKGDEPEYYVTKDGLDVEGIIKRLKQSEADGEPVYLMGATFGYVHFFDFCKSKEISFKLPEGSRIGDGGGYKGRSREMSKEDYFSLTEEVLGIKKEYMINNYGMTELAVVFTDNVLRNHLNGKKEPRNKYNPAWTRTQIVDPDTLEELPKGETGLLKHINLANPTSVMAVQTDDLGFAIGDGFECVGRAKGSEARGCSIAIDELLSAQGT